MVFQNSLETILHNNHDALQINNAQVLLQPNIQRRPQVTAITGEARDDYADLYFIELGRSGKKDQICNFDDSF